MIFLNFFIVLLTSNKIIHDLKIYSIHLLTTIKNKKTTKQKQSVKSTFSAIKDVGFAEINILSASGLKAADIGGKSDPFCIVKLCNAHAQTHTCKKTLDPVWNRSFTL